MAKNIHHLDEQTQGIVDAKQKDIKSMTAKLNELWSIKKRVILEKDSMHEEVIAMSMERDAL